MTAHLIGSYHDVGTQDTQTLSIDWDGDNVYDETVAVSGGSFDIKHLYEVGGVFTVHAKLTDDDTGFATGAVTVSVNPKRGDWNFDGAVTAADVPTMLAALCDLGSYQAVHQLTPGQLLQLGDFDFDGAITNADIQGHLAGVMAAVQANESTSDAAVPGAGSEPLLDAGGSQAELSISSSSSPAVVGQSPPVAGELRTEVESAAITMADGTSGCAQGVADLMPMSSSFAQGSITAESGVPASPVAVTVSGLPNPAIAPAESVDIDAATKSAEVVHLTSGQNNDCSMQLGIGIESSDAVPSSAPVAHFAAGSVKAETPEARRDHFYARLAATTNGSGGARAEIAIADEDLADACFAGLSLDLVSL